jgi:DNA polymerase III alpha subunit (gram-positive type)
MMEVYFSTDIEADGPIPGRNSMLSFGSAAFLPDGTMVDTYSANLDTLPEATQDLDTMEWWKGQKEAWDAHRVNTRPAEVVMPEYVQWVKDVCKKHNAKPVFVGYPAGFDFLFMYWYMRAFAGESPFSFSALDIKTAAMVQLNTDYRAATKKRFPKKWFGKRRHTHVALDDAIEQGEMWCNMLKDIRRSEVK